jgi:hypothetical protein
MSGTESRKTVYNVHLYREMRLYYPGIKAASHEEAARIAADRSSADADMVEDCDGENLAALIDVDGDTEYLQSRTVDFEPTVLRTHAEEVLKAMEAGQSKDWVANAGITTDIEALRKICLAHADWWNNIAWPLIAKARGQQ